MELYFALPNGRNMKKFLLWLFFIANIALIFFLWWTKSNYYILNPNDGNLLIALGRITGLLGEYFLLIQLVLIGRISWIESLYGFDKLNKFHRFIGYSVLSLLIFHPILLIVGNAKSNAVSFLSQFADFLANKENVLIAYFALLFLIFVVIISIVIVRKKLKYETWYFVHLLTYLAIGLALGHQLGTGDLRTGWTLQYWYIINFGIFGIFLLYRFIRPLFIFFRHRFYISDIVEEALGVSSVYISGKKMDKFSFEPGQYANINILSKGMLYTHPFSFSSSFNGQNIRFTIKNLGDFTAKIHDLKPNTKVVIDGPLGLFVSRLSNRDEYLFIAGGIGITPLRSMIESLSKENKSVVLLYSCKTAEEIIFKNELDEFCRSNPNLKVHFCLSTETPGFEVGRIDKEKIIRLVPDFYSREVYLCGPKPMMDSTVQNLKEIGFSPAHIHFENFSF